VLAILTSALASTQTTILPASRTSLSMARQGAFPEAFGRVHSRFLTPHISTIVIGAIAAVWYGILNTTSQNFLFDSLTSLSLMIAFYYALTGFACAIYYRRELTKSVKNFFFIGVGPVTGALILSFLFVRAIDEYRQTGQSYSGSQVFGAAVPVVLGLGLLLLGVVLMLIWRATGHEEFFGRRRKTVDPDVAAGRRVGVAAVPEEAV
jgi:amino acid transporter